MIKCQMGFLACLTFYLILQGGSCQYVGYYRPMSFTTTRSYHLEGPAMHFPFELGYSMFYKNHPEEFNKNIPDQYKIDSSPNDQTFKHSEYTVHMKTKITPQKVVHQSKPKTENSVRDETNIDYRFNDDTDSDGINYPEFPNNPYLNPSILSRNNQRKATTTNQRPTQQTTTLRPRARTTEPTTTLRPRVTEQTTTLRPRARTTEPTTTIRPNRLTTRALKKLRQYLENQPIDSKVDQSIRETYTNKDKSTIVFPSNDPTTRPQGSKTPSRLENLNAPATNRRTTTTELPFHSNLLNTNKPHSDPVYVMPIDFGNREPITNTPPNKNSYDSSIYFPTNENDGPALVDGLDEANMSTKEKRRAVMIAENKCSEYRRLTKHDISAIPLLPRPNPVSVSISENTCNLAPLIVGGSAVDIESFPHMAALGWKKVRESGYSYKCGGSLISDQFVLTAAHCTYQERDNTVLQGAPRVVHLGSAILNSPEATIVNVKEVTRHPSYRPPVAYHDVALLRLASRVQFSDKIRPACLGSPPTPGHKIIATGWGKTEFGGEESEQLRGVSLPVWNLSECGTALGSTRRLPRGPLEGVQMCAGDAKGGKDTCQGDSGGPAMVGEQDCTWRIVGLTSFGRACGAPNTPAVYAVPSVAWVAATVWM